VLKFFNADPQEYLAIFTSNASGALKLVGESYPFAKGRYLLTFDNHNSVNGIREFAHCKGADIHYVPVRREDLRLDEDMLFEALREVGTSVSAEAAGAEAADAPTGRPDKLFAYPAQSNFSGVQHPLEWVARAQELGWDVVLDCAAFVPTNRLDLSAVKPDFVPISLYKMFGYPTGVGALLARRDTLGKLQRPWFAGGTITLASVQEELARRRISLVTGWPADVDGSGADPAAGARVATPPEDDVFALRLPTLLLANKADLLDHADTDLEVLAELEEPHFPALLVSALTGAGLGDLGGWLWRSLGLVRVYTKAPGRPAERERPFTLRAGEQTVGDAARLVHRDMVRTLKFARVWGRSVTADGQHVGREHRLADGDVLELHA
jgi:hypothetical protein